MKMVVCALMLMGSVAMADQHGKAAAAPHATAEKKMTEAEVKATCEKAHPVKTDKAGFDKCVADHAKKTH